MNIIWSPTSRKKIETIVDYISADNINAALSLVEEFEDRVQSLKDNPRLGRKVQQLNNDRIRELIVHRNYRIIYEIKDDSIIILTIHHSRQGGGGFKPTSA